MYIVPGHLRHDPANRQLAVFGVIERTVDLVGREPAPHREIQAAQADVCVERGVCVCGSVEWNPVVLRESLRGVWRLREGKARARCQREFGLREMDQLIAGDPAAEPVRQRSRSAT